MGNLLPEDGITHQIQIFPMGQVVDPDELLSHILLSVDIPFFWAMWEIMFLVKILGFGAQFFLTIRSPKAICETSGVPPVSLSILKSHRTVR
jgi:hypothetical protein